MAARSKPTGGPAGRDWKIAVALGLITGQLGYLYTRQPKRLGMSLLLGVLALALAFAGCYAQMPAMDPNLALDPEWQAQLSKALALPTLVSLLNNVACAVDLYLQVKAAN